MTLRRSDHRDQDGERRTENLRVQVSTAPLTEKYPAKQHARNVAKRLPTKDGLIYLLAQPTRMNEDSDTAMPFRQRRYFLYLTGCHDMADCSMTYSIADDKLSLYIPPVDPKQVPWMGMPRLKDECAALYDVDAVHHTTEITAHVSAFHLSNPSARFYIIHEQSDDIVSVVPPASIDNTHLQPAINNARVLKDAYEIAQIRQANEITAAAHLTVFKSVKHLTNEAEVEALFLGASVARKAKVQAYAPICGSGRNAATLHYVKNDEPLHGRQLLLVDAGAEWDGYTSDVTRTFPISGTWSTEAKAVYDIVERMQEECIKMTVPGTDYTDVNRHAHRRAIEGLLQLGILRSGTEEEIYAAGTSRLFFPHGLGHHMGLDVHDVEGSEYKSLIPCPGRVFAEAFRPRHCSRASTSSTSSACSTSSSTTTSSTACSDPLIPPTATAPTAPTTTVYPQVLQPNMVLTVEPGIYFCDVAIRPYLDHPVHGRYIDKDVLERYWDVGGVRIEDDILVTEGGNVNLTTALKGKRMLDAINGVGVA